ncbi:MAG: hypothetical protein EZS26_003019 [Candidatus Ordinivivax streblomastigis]|uniref:Uncharacterized protein n=1 Tax=Candidatus Ordinivivax streblomastigis TaxID=2540710 RepID=A0A5M8NWP3_9BACT|nr:MAG: hypothetical protein EZS26_003019 [Candidatus Ordinivivax streblomastigis]
MKHLIFSLIAFLAICYASCTGQYDNVDKNAGEVIYPARFDTIFGKIGYERVELDLLNAGRLPSSELHLGQASKTVVEYDGVKHYVDSVCSWVNVTGLTQSKLYRFYVYTEDEFENPSVPQEIALIPFTQLDRDLVSVASPKLSVSPSSLVVEWPNGLNSVVMDYVSLSYQYTDKDGEQQNGSTKDARFYCGNLPAGQEVTVDISYKVVPITSDGTKILDTVVVTKPLTLTTPIATTPFSPSEPDILRANGITTFTSAAVQSVTKLVYPLHVVTFQDLFYFPNLEELVLTGEGLSNILPVLTYDRNTVKTQCGGGAWQPFMLRSDKKADIHISSIAALTDILESGQLKRVRYIPNSMALDDILAPYVASGVVKLVQDSDPVYTDPVFIEPQFFVNGQVVDNNWEMLNFYSGSFLPRPGLSDTKHFDIAGGKDVVNGKEVDLHLDQLLQQDGKNIYRCVIYKRSASFAMALPKEYMYDNKRYKNLKFKMFCGTEASIMEGANQNFLQPWIRPMNYMWNFGSNSNYGQENWDITQPQTNWIQTDQIQTQWKEYTIDMSANTGGDTNRRNRAIVFNIGHEPGGDYAYDENKQAVLYVADIRFTKN